MKIGRIKPFTLLELFFVILALIINNKTAEGIIKAIFLIIFIEGLILVIMCVAYVINEMRKEIKK